MLVVTGVWGSFHPVFAQDKRISISAPDSLIETGLLKHILPRFSLKHNIRVTVTRAPETGSMAFQLDPSGLPVFKQNEEIWHLRVTGEDPNGYLKIFENWLLSAIGKRAIEGFSPKAGGPFSTNVISVVAKRATATERDTNLGKSLAMKNCGRCHAIDESNRKKTIGSTPSFGALRTFQDWEYRFEAFYTLNPHPSFTQIEEVTPPFPAGSPPAITPIKLTLDELDEILAFTRQIEPADLGRAVQSN